MNTIEQLQAAVEHLTLALSYLDQSGADLTAAHVDGAIECLRMEVSNRSWQVTLDLDYSHLDRIIEATYAKSLSNDAPTP